MKDFLGVEIGLDDSVVVTQPRYRNFVKATVIALTPQKVRVEFWYQGSYHQYLSEPNFLIVIPLDTNHKKETL